MRSTAPHAVVAAMFALAVAACSGTTVTVSVDAGAPPQTCTNANECAARANPCEVAVCVGGVCGSSSAPAGTFVPDSAQVKSDCKKISCGDNGAFATAADGADLPADDGNACTSEACDGPNPTHPNKAIGASCAAGDAGPGVCNGTGTCGVCRPGVVECSGNTPRSCGTDGSWTDGAVCPFVCSGAGQCTGVCAPAAVDCQGKQPRLCNAQGQWASNGAQCTNVCSNGACAGSCPPGSLQCSGNVPQSCDNSGAWASTAACTFACVSGQCAGVCTPGGSQCSGLNVQSCSASGQWQTTSTCPYVCSTGNCGGVCSPGAKRCVGTTSQSCDASGQWVDASTCTYACSAGNCTGVCAPGATRCSGNFSQTCDSLGQWQTSQTCPFACTGSGTCGGVCTPTSTRCTGNNADTCDASGQWQSTQCQFACASSSCTGICTPAATRCNGAQSQLCSATGQWTTTQTCAYVCTGSGTCSGTCAPGTTQCSGTTPQSCDASGSWVSGTTCSGATPLCFGGTCGAQLCASLDFASGGHATVAVSPSLDVGSSWTVAFWERPVAASGDGAIWGNDVSGSDCGTMVIRSTGSPSGIVYNAFAAAGCSAGRLAPLLQATSYVPPAATWTHITIVVDGTVAKLYVNGSLQRTDSVSLVDPGLSPYAHRIAWDGAHHFDGQIADLAMWNRALTSSEVSMIRASGVRILPADPALLIWLPANEGSGTTVADASGRGHPATLTGGARWSTLCPWR